MLGDGRTGRGTGVDGTDVAGWTDWTDGTDRTGWTDGTGRDGRDGIGWTGDGRVWSDGRFFFGNID